MPLAASPHPVSPRLPEGSRCVSAARNSLWCSAGAKHPWTSRQPQLCPLARDTAGSLRERLWGCSGGLRCVQEHPVLPSPRGPRRVCACVCSRSSSAPAPAQRWPRTLGGVRALICYQPALPHLSVPVLSAKTSLLIKFYAFALFLTHILPSSNELTDCSTFFFLSETAF